MVSRDSRKNRDILTGITFPVKVIFWIAVTFQVQASLLSSRTVREWDMIICNVIEEVDFFFFEKQTCGNGVDWSITPTLVEEPTIFIKSLEVVQVGFWPEPVEITNFKVRPLKFISKYINNVLIRTHHVAVVIRISTIITQKAHWVTLSNVLGVCLHELLRAIP